MGYSAYSNVIYGIEVDRKDLERKENVRGCIHDTNDKAKFCQECGEPVWVEETVSALDDISDSDSNGKLSYFTESGDAYHNKNYRFMIGFKLGETNYNNNRSYVSDSTELMKQKILDFIKKNKLKHNEKSIRTIVFTYHSY